MRSRNLFLSLLFLGVIILFGGCTSLRAWVRDVPVWVVEKPANSLSKIYFTSQGVSEDGIELTARDLANEQLLEAVSEFLGYDVRDTYRRELLQTDGIQEISLQVTESFLQEEGQVKTVYILAEANRKTISRLVRENLESIKEQEGRINTPETEAKSAYRRQDDFAAFEYYITAALEAYRSPLAVGTARYGLLMEDAITVLEALNLQATESDPDEGVFTVSVTRGSGVFAPKIASVPLKATFPVKNAAGNTRLETLLSDSDSRGQVTFSPMHTTFRGSGTLRVVLDAEGILEELTSTVGADDQYVQRIRSILVDKQLSFSYSISSKVAGRVIVASILEYGRGGDLLLSSWALDGFIDRLEQDNMFTNRVDVTSERDTTEKVLSFARQTYADSRTVGVVGSVGISSIVTSSDRFVASVKGDLSIYTLADGKLLSATGEFAANGQGTTREAAQQAAFSRFGQIAATLVSSKLL